MTPDAGSVWVLSVL